MTISSRPPGAQAPLPSYEAAFGAGCPFEPWDAWELIQQRRKRSHRARRPSAAQLVTLAQGGVEVVVADGSITYRPLPVAPPSTDGDDGSELDAWIAKHHAH